ncbi:MAG: threonine/serine dehydratase [Blastocatellia bacterium]|nr:threonine/serine dehydratase [Blastocatellia bacterium]
MTFHIPVDNFHAARERIRPYVRQTPVLPLPAAHQDGLVQVRYKLENLQVGGSFKARGVFNNLLQLTPEERSRGVITASGGNHGVALAYGAQHLGIPAVVYLPETATADRIARVTRWGATVLRHGAAWDDANRKAVEQSRENGMTYVHAFDAVGTIEGQGTLGLELLEDFPAMDVLFVAIGGGGLLAGVAAAIKESRPEVRIIGVEPVGAPSMTTSLEAGKLVELPGLATIAETLAPRMVSERTLWFAQKYVDEVLLVTDQQMVAAMRYLWVECNQLVEPAGAASIAAMTAFPEKISGSRCPVALICGGNANAESVFSTYQPK